MLKEQKNIKKSFRGTWKITTERIRRIRKSALKKQEGTGMKKKKAKVYLKEKREHK